MYRIEKQYRWSWTEGTGKSARPVGMVSSVCSPSTEQVETGRRLCLPAASLAEQHMLQVQEKPSLKEMRYRENDKRRSWGWRDGSAVKNTDCSSEGSEFKSQQPHGGSQPSVTRSDTLFWSV